MDGGRVRCESDQSGRAVGGADGGRIDTPGGVGFGFKKLGCMRRWWLGK
jgi:hypothetical protein